MEASKLQEEYTQLNSEISIIKEALELRNQHIYDLKKNIALTTALKDDYLQEIELLKSNKNLLTVNWQHEIKKLEETIANLQSAHNAKLINKCEIEANLIKEIQELKRTATKKEVNSENEFINKQKLKHEQLKNEITHKREKLLGVQKNIEDLNFANSKLEDTLKTLNGDLNTKVEYLSTKVLEYEKIQISIQKLQEEMFETKLELDSLKCKPLDPSQKGNSMFAEVEDSRMKLQQKLVHIKKLYTNLQHDAIMKIKYMKIACRKNLELCNRLNPTQDCKEDYLEEQLAGILARIPALELDLEECKEALNKEIAFDVQDLPSCVAAFANNTIDELCNNAVKMGDEVNTISKNAVKIISQIKIATREMLEWKRKNFKLKVEIVNLECAELEEQFQLTSVDLKHVTKVKTELIFKSETPFKVINETPRKVISETGLKMVNETSLNGTNEIPLKVVNETHLKIVNEAPLKMLIVTPPKVINENDISDTENVKIRVSYESKNVEKCETELIYKSETPLKVINENVIQNVEEIKNESCNNISVIEETEIKSENRIDTIENVENIDENAKYHSSTKLQMGDFDVNIKNKENVPHKSSNIPVVIKKK